MQKKRVLSLVLSMIVCIVMMPMAVFADNATGGGAEEPVGVWTDEEFVAESFAGGSGTKDDPYKIETAGQLAKLAADINSGVEDKNHSKEYFILTKDIDLSAHKWEPIGICKNNSGKSFQGYFDGKENSITGLYVDETTEQNSAGLFGYVTGYEIKNLIVEGGYVTTADSGNQYDAAGILIGNAPRGYGMTISIKNCTVSGTVETNTAISGGLVGKNSYGSYENCTADVNIIGAGKAGGFVGEDYNGKYSNCTAKGKVSGAWSVGGFAGILFFGTTVEKCASYGKVEATDWNTGGFVGYVKNGVKIEKCVSYSDVSNTVNMKVGGFVGTNDGKQGDNVINKSHAVGKIACAQSNFPPGGFIAFDEKGTTNGCSFDKTKNADINGVGCVGTEGINDIAGETTQKVLSNICRDYYDGHNSITVSAKEATTTEEGWAEHSECSRCGAWLDNEGKEIEKELIPKKSSGGGYYKPVQKPEISAGEGGKTSLENNGTTLVITPDEGMQVSKVTVNGKEVTVTDNKVTGLKTGDKVEVTFTKIPPTKEELDKEFKEKAGEIELVVRTSKTSKNNIKVTVKLTPALEAFIKEIKSAGYTVKYKFYRSANKSSKYAARITKEEAEYLNTEGKKDKKYYYKAKLLVYDNEGNLVAQTELKQCKYGLRTWSK